VANYPLILSSGQTGMRKAVQTSLAAHGRSVAPIAEIDSHRTLLDVVENGTAHTILPASALQRQLKHPADHPLIINALDLSRNVVLCTSEHLPLGATAAAVHALLESL